MVKENSLLEFKYYIDNFKRNWSIRGPQETTSLKDKNGVIMVPGEYFKQKFSCNEDIENFYHPGRIAQAAFGYFDNYVDTQNPEYKISFFSQIKWLEENFKEYRNAYIYPFPFATKGFGTKPGWISGMIQGEILSCFVKAYVLTNNKNYLHLCEKVYNSFSLKLGDKYGFKTEDDYGLWFEESMLTPASHILNGFIFSLFGIYDYYKLTQRSDIKVIFDKALNTK